VTNSDSSLPLFVDVDGTLIKSDLMFESVLLLLKHNLVYLLLIPFWLLKGRAFLKHQLAQHSELPVERLPLNEEFLAYLVAQKNAGRSITLISGSNQASVTRLGNHLKLFDAAIGSDTQTNLKAAAKLQRIQELNTGSFGYAGNSSADLPIWAAAQQVIMVNCNDALVKRLGNDTILRFDTASSTLQKLWQAMRPHQWLKNLLVFIPLVLSHQANQIELLMLVSIGFISFSLCASSVYLLNDMLDLNSDRQHHSKSQRPFASGELPLAAGFLAVPGLLLVAFAVALLLPAAFLAVLFSYWLLTSLYSFFLKRLFLVDVFTLAVLYTMRIAAGAAAISIITTNFLIAFSLFLFLGLAMVKRVTELVNLAESEQSLVDGRAYGTEHTTLLSLLGVGSSGIAVLVFAFYINAEDTTRLYGSPIVLWLICPLLLYLLARIWQQARAGRLDEDPVLFAITDRVSQLIILLCGVLMWLAA